MSPPLVLGIDVGGTNIRLAVVNTQGKISMRNSFSAEFSEIDPANAESRIIDTLSQSIFPLLTHHPDIAAIGIGFPGFFDTQSGQLISSPNIPGLYDFPLAETLSQRLDRPVFVQNDASLAALGEFRFSADQGPDSLLHLTLGTGIGGGLILDGKMHVGDGGMAMEIGHMHITPEDRVCGCGATGCLETYASATAVIERYAEQSGRHLGAREVCLQAEEGDQQALAVVEDAGHYLGRAIAETIKLLDIHHVSISGGLSGAWPLLFPALSQALEKHLIPPLRGRVHVRRSTLGDDAGILGAAALTLENIT